MWLVRLLHNLSNIVCPGHRNIKAGVTSPSQQQSSFGFQEKCLGLPLTTTGIRIFCDMQMDHLPAVILWVSGKLKTGEPEPM
jgi:hypothetical protein